MASDGVTLMAVDVQSGRERLLIDERRARYERLVADLRARHGVELRMDNVDTTRNVIE